jgi:tetratricopeptide (TPR) repeat protein
MKATLGDVSQALRYWPVIMTVALFAAVAKPLSPQTQKAATGEALPLPVACQNLAQSSRRIADLLTTVAGNPTAEAYNTLGALFAQQSKLECAIPAFEQALGLDDNDWRARYNLALALIAKGEGAKAADHLHILIRQKPDSPAVHNTLGTLLRKQGELEAAAAEFKAALNGDPGLAVAALNLGQVLIAQKRYTAAAVYLHNALKSSTPPDLEVSLESALAVAYAENGHSDLAIDTLKRTITSHPDAAEAYFNLATLYAKNGPALGREKAITYFKETLRLDPRYDDARYSLAKVLVELGQFSDAVPYLMDYTRNQPNDAEGFRLLGSAYSGLTQTAKSIEVLERARKLKPDNSDIGYELGVALVKIGKTEEAIAELEAAERADPNSSGAHYQLALLLRKRGDEARSRREMQLFQALKNQENEAIAAGNLNNQGNQLLQEGKIREAAEAYRKATELDPDNAQWHYNLSLALSRLGETQSQEAELEKALRLDPRMDFAHNDLGLVHLSEGSMKQAEGDFKTALEINPEFAEAQNNLAIVYSREGRGPEAVALFRQATESDPHYVKAFVNLGLELARQGDYPAAEQPIQDALKLAPNDPGILTTLGMVEGKMNQHQKSIRTFREVVARSPDSSDAHLNLGIALADNYDLLGALKEFSEAIRLAPNDAAAYYNKGRVLYDLDRRQEALPFLETACKLQPVYPQALYLLAVVLGASPHATEVLERLVAIDGRNAAAHYMLGQDLLAEGKTPEAIAQWKTAVKLDPQNSSSLYNLARTLAKANDPEAKQYMERFQKLQQTNQLSDRVKTLNNFALEAANARNWPQAVEQLQQSIKICGQCGQLPALHRNLGLIYARKGEIRQSELELEIALKMNPRDADAQQALETLRSISQQSDSSSN